MSGLRRVEDAPRVGGRASPCLVLACAVVGAWWFSLPVTEARERTAVIRVTDGAETAQALRRVGVASTDAEEAARLIGPVVSPGDMLAVTLGRPAGAAGSARLARIAARQGLAQPIVFTRGYDGTLRLADPPAPPREVVTLAEGVMGASLYDSAQSAGADTALMEKVASIFGRRLDLARDLAPGDRFRIVFKRTITPAGETLATGDLLYAEVAGKAGLTRLYAFDDHGRTTYLDPGAASAGGPLLRTPVAGARVSSVYGMRLHPILGYTRMHQGIDFAAPMGTPIVAAGDGVIVEAGPRAGYGAWLRIHHDGGWDTAYAHLSGYAPGVRPGIFVRQGQIIGYVGESGVATGPHLHYEVWRDGVRVDPATVPCRGDASLDSVDRARFLLQKARIDALLALPAPPSQPVVSARSGGLRPRIALASPTHALALRLTPNT